MHIHLHEETVPTRDDWVDTALAAAGPARQGTLVASMLGHSPQGLRTTTITFLASSADPCDFVVEGVRRGTHPGPARFVQVTRFEGPRTPEWVAAERRASQERVWPAVEGVSGFVVAFQGRAADGDTLSIVLATSVESLLEGQRRILSTELLPGEDPAMLTGPDRIDILQIAHVELPETTEAPMPVSR